MLDPEFKAKWVAALRSGNYDQTRHALYDGTGYCCLGVACKVAGAEFTDYFDGNNYKGWVAKLDGNQISTATYLDENFASKIGLTYDGQRDLAGMNDHLRSFNEIADCIEKNL